MDETGFWELIDASRDEAEDDPVEQGELVFEALLERTPDEVTDFARQFEARWLRCWTYDLWGAADLLLGGSDEEAFDSFCCWVIAQGREVLESALADPDSLADLVPDFDDEAGDGNAVELAEAPEHAYEQLTGGHLPPLGLPPRPERPAGRDIDFEDEQLMRARYPKLWALYGA